MQEKEGEPKQENEAPNTQEEEKKDVVMEEEKVEPFVELTAEQLVELIEELTDLVELHPRNNLNLCLMGGMTEILCLIFSHEND